MRKTTAQIMDNCFDKALESFDIDEVVRIMDRLEWRWAFDNATPKSIQIESLVRKLYELCREDCLDALANNKEWSNFSYSSGGLELQMFVGEKININIDFVPVQSWHSVKFNKGELYGLPRVSEKGN